MSAPIALNGTRTEELLRAVIAEYGPEYEYSHPSGACLYVHVQDGRAVPGCLVGHALHAAGVPLGALALHEHFQAGVTLSRLQEAGVLEASPRAVRLLSVAQEEQDCGRPWGGVPGGRAPPGAPPRRLTVPARRAGIEPPAGGVPGGTA